ncbi:MAG: hypothetical protein ACK4K2_02520 [Dehalococcoidia bacterium]
MNSIEISPGYVATARERLANVETERPRLVGEIKRHRVELTFQERKARGLTRPPKQQQGRFMRLL